MFHRPVFFFIILFSFQIHAQDAQVDSCRHLNADEFYITMQSCEYPLVIDTRSTREFRRDRIPGAILVKTRSELDKMGDSLDLDQPLFLYCEGGYRSRVACRILCKRGFRNVYNLREGLIEWRLSPYPLDRKRIPRKRKGSNG